MVTGLPPKSVLAQREFADVAQTLSDQVDEWRDAVRAKREAWSAFLANRTHDNWAAYELASELAHLEEMEVDVLFSHLLD